MFFGIKKERKTSVDVFTNSYDARIIEILIYKKHDEDKIYVFHIIDIFFYRLRYKGADIYRFIHFRDKAKENQKIERTESRKKQKKKKNMAGYEVGSS